MGRSSCVFVDWPKVKGHRAVVFSFISYECCSVV